MQEKPYGKVAMLFEEWIQKAEGDFLVMNSLAAMDKPVWDAVGFHAQQCVEKYFKAYLCQQRQTIPKTHDLSRLLQILIKLDKQWACFDNAELITLSQGAVECRYPGASLTRGLCNEMIETCTTIRKAFRKHLVKG